MEKRGWQPGGHRPWGFFVWFTQLELQETQTVTYCTLASQLPHFLSLSEWCHGPAGDVVSISSPFPFLSSASVPLWPGTISGARTNKQPSEHVKTSHYVDTLTKMYIFITHIVWQVVFFLILKKSLSVNVKPDASPSFALKTPQDEKNTPWFKPDVADLITLAHENRCGPKEPRWESKAGFARIRCHHVSALLARKSSDFPASFINQPLQFSIYDECWIMNYIHWCLKRNITTERKQLTYLWPNKP